MVTVKRTAQAAILVPPLTCLFRFQILLSFTLEVMDALLFSSCVLDYVSITCPRCRYAWENAMESCSMSSQSTFCPSRNKPKDICDREDHSILAYAVREFGPWSVGFFAFRPAEREQLAW